MTKQYALITGASMGIGKAIAQSCASRGMNLILVSLPGENLEELSYQIASQYNIDTCFLELDMASDAGPEKLLHWCREQNLAVDTLVTNAGIGYEGD
jgi:short-subunit dehydrogenase